MLSASSSSIHTILTLVSKCVSLLESVAARVKFQVLLNSQSDVCHVQIALGVVNVNEGFADLSWLENILLKADSNRGRALINTAPG